MPLTVVEANKAGTNVVRREAIVKTFEENSPLLRGLPIMNITGDAYAYNVEEALPNVGWRGYNEGFQESYGVINPKVEALKILGSEFKVDRRLLRTHGPQIRANQEQAHVRAMALALNREIIKGDSGTNPREFDGLRARIVGNQLIPANLSTPNNSGPLSLEALMAAIDAVRNPTAIVMSKAMYRKISKAAHQNLGGEITVGVDQFGYRTPYFENLPIWTVDYDNLGHHIIDFDETGPDGHPNTTSVYVISAGYDGVMLLQNGPIEVIDVGEMEAAPQLLTRIEWMVGMAVMHGRAAARVWGITNEDVTA